MIPSVVATQVRHCVSDYLQTTFRPTTPGFEGLMDRFLAQPENICRGPYISISLPFRPGLSGPNFFRDIPLTFTPHLHQERAFQRLSPPYYQSTLIATGTGSGKTECFLLPLLEHCRQHQGELGIKAILIYPMNALATDQAKRIASLIHSLPSLQGNITAGLYIGEQDDTPTTLMGASKIITDKRILRESPPDILLTNYKMLDYLLVQPDTQKLWQYNQPETLRYIIVDEFHTFDGAQGTDLACLLRRLKHRLKTPPNHLACVGTSATLGSNASQADMQRYAETIFQEPFTDGALIEEDRLTAAEFLQDALLNVLPVPGIEALDLLNPDHYSSPDAYIRAQAALWLQDLLPQDGGLPLGAAFEQQHLSLLDPSPQQLSLSSNPDPDASLSDEWRVHLGVQLKTLPIVHNLIRFISNSDHKGTITYTELIDKLGKTLQLPRFSSPQYHERLLDSLLTLIAAARRQIQRADGSSLTIPWVNLRVQLWFRELKRMVGTVTAQPELQFSDDLTPQELKKALPVLHCRDCGATGWGGVRPSQGANKLVANDLRRFYQEYFGRKPLLAFVFPAHENAVDVRKLCGDCLTLNAPRVDQCLSCGNEDLIRVHVPEIVQSEDQQGQKVAVSSGDCPYCRSSNGLSILGAQAASLSSAMIGVLYTTPFNRDKKLLTFSDSVQDAAHRAGFYGARTYRTTLRTAIAHLISQSPTPISLEALIQQFPQYWQHQLGSAGNYVATFLPNDLEWLREWDQFVRSDRLDLDSDTRLTDLVNERLVWEIVSQFGHRSTVGPTLERSGACATSFNPDLLVPVISALQLQLSNEVEALRQVTPEQIRQFLLGLLHHLRQKGGILQPLTEIYIQQGNTFLLQRSVCMPSLGPSTPVPIFLVNSRGADRFEKVMHLGPRQSWCEDWTARVFSTASLLLKDQLQTILQLTLDRLVEAGLLETRPSGAGQAWGIPLSTLQLEADGMVMVCDRCNHQLTAALTEQTSLEGMVCLNPGCTGHYHPDPRTGLAYYRQLYRSGEVRRIMAAEHTGLLARANREWLEQRFVQGDRRCDPNLLSATSTLEMGINIGDLSTVLLCSVPPTPANFQQRVGRAGRTDGNALVGIVANGKPHDLFFYTNPTRMLAGEVESAGCYLDAAAILQRQLTAFCLDTWVATGLSKQEFPRQLSDVLNAIERHDQSRFPYNWLTFIQERQSELFERFITLFQNNIEDLTQQQLRLFMEQGEQDQGGLRWRILDRLDGIRRERTRLSSQIKTISKKIKDLKAEPAALQDQERLQELVREQSGFKQLMQDINDKHILNFLTDEGLLPNYAFPEAGVTLRSILWRQKSQAEAEDGKKYETFTITYERPSQLAIKELVPSGVFYAEGRRVKIDQIDLKLSEPQEWRICRSCNYSVQSFQPEAHSQTCPRCGDTMWSDQGRVRRMLRLRQVMASTADRRSRFGDDSEERAPGFFQRHLLVDFRPEYREKTFLVQDKEFPFGIEYISRTSFREVNLGESGALGESVELAGQKFTTQGFRVCRACGKVMRGDRAKDHTISCQYRDKPDQAKALDVLYLYREFESEAIRFLMPDENFWTAQGLHSFIAALQLGLKLKFGGKVDHLHTVMSEEPQPNSSLRKSFLYLFDSIPGGTGYLRQLIRNPEELRDVFGKALAVLRACDCPDGCYSCLFAYRNSFDQDETSRLTALRLLSAIETHWAELAETSAGLSAIQLNSNFESELERQFIEAIRRYHGKVYQGAPPLLRKEIINGRAGYYLKIGETSWTIEMQVSLNQQDGVSIPSRADFLIRPASSRLNARPIAIFTDGWEYHKDRIGEDFQQRTAIVRSEQFWCWSLSWDDIATQLDPDKPLLRPNGLACSLNGKVVQQIYQGYQCQAVHCLEDRGSFEWLMYYLANPNGAVWQRWAALQTVVQTRSNLPVNNTWQRGWFEQVIHLTHQDALDFWEPPDKFIGAEVSVSPVLTIWSAVDLQRHQPFDPTGSFVLLKLNDTSHPNQTELKESWIEALRLLNLYQFLPHSYAVTTSHIEQGKGVLLPKLSIIQPQAVGQTEDDEQWEQIRQLTLEERLLPAIDQMRQEQWPIPESGYELGDRHNQVLAMAELAWPTHQIAITLTEDDQDQFTEAGWYAWELEAFLQSMDSIGARLKGDG